MVQANHRPFVAEANSVERFMYEGNYGFIRIVQNGEESQVIEQSEEPFSVNTLTEIFNQMRPNIVDLEKPAIGKKAIQEL